MEKGGPARAPERARRILLAGIGILSLFSFLKMPGFARRKRNALDCAPPGSGQTAKWLSQDGTLVEVDISKISSVKKKITDQELQNWIRKQ
jgi:hypothetical protein